MSFLRILLILIAFIFAHVNKLNAKVILLTSFDTWHIYRTNESCFITSKPIPKSGQEIIRYLYITNTSIASNEISLLFYDKFKPSKIISISNSQKYQFFRKGDSAWLGNSYEDQAFLLEILDQKRIRINLTENNVNYEYTFSTLGLKEALKYLNETCKYKINSKIANALNKNFSKKEKSDFKKEKAKRLEEERKIKSLEQKLASLEQEKEKRIEEESKRKELEKKLASLQSEKKKQIKKTKQKEIGSGFYVSKFRHIVTNQHVVNKCKKITVGYSMSTQIPADLIASDKRNDLAILQTVSMEMASADAKSFVEKLAMQIVPVLSGGLMRTDDVVGGEEIFVAGYPLGNMVSDQMKLTDGIVSATKGLDNDVTKFEISSVVRKGNSGGPIYDSKGNIVGVVLERFNVNRSDNINFAIKGSTVKQFLSAHNVSTKWSDRQNNMSTKDIYQLASKQTVMVVCHR